MTRYLISFSLWLLAFVGTWLLSPVLPLCARPQSGWINNHEKLSVEPRLPWFLRWLSTSDNSLLGDDGHKERWAGKSQYWQMSDWLRRNAAYDFTWDVLGVEPKGAMKVTGDPWIKNRDNAVASVLDVEFDNCWMHKSVTQTGPKTCRMLEFGWRLQPWAQGRGSGKAQFVFSIRPSTAFYKD